jgi:beta-galactosidase
MRVCDSVALMMNVGCHGLESQARSIDRPHAAPISLCGRWQFQLDPKSVGERERWFDGHRAFADVIEVPGCWDAQGKGVKGAITTVANADDTEPNVRAISAYNGDAWYRRDFTIDPAWKDKIIWLHIGAVNDRASVWINGKPAGNHDGYCTGFRLDITHLIQLQGANSCVIRVSNAPRPAGNLEGGMDFYTNWGGIYRDVWLEATGRTWIDQLQITPDVSAATARVQMRVLTRWPAGQGTVRAKLHLLSDNGAELRSEAGDLTFQSSGSAGFEAAIKIADPKLWSPASPYLYRLRAEIWSGDKRIDAAAERFGMREIRAQGKRVLLNGRPIFLRGYGDGCIYPLTISPPASKEHYMNELRRAKVYGFNFARHHTWIPLPEHLDAADEVGMLMQAEMPTGLHPIAEPSPFLAQLWRDELERVIAANMNHPSLVIYSMGNELGDALKSDKTRAIYFDLTAHGRTLDPTRLFTVTSGSTTPLPNEEPIYDRGIYEIEPMAASPKAVAGWVAEHDRPFVWHEMGYFASYPDVSLRSKFTGGAIPFWLNKAEAVAKERGFADQLPTYVRNSQRLQQICRKWEMELARKTPLAGFQWWTFKDDSWPTEGIVDDFTDAKPGADAETIRRLNDDTVLLLAEEPRTARAGEMLKRRVMVSHFGDRPLHRAKLMWELQGREERRVGGLMIDIEVQKAGLNDVGEIQMRLPMISVPAKYALHLTLHDNQQQIENEWRLWVFPEVKQMPPGAVRIASSLSEEVIAYVEAGGRLLLMSRTDRGGLPERPCAAQSADIPYPLYFAPTYWGAPYAPGGGNLGTVIADHPALGTFPHEGFCDLQFLSLLRGVGRADLDALPVKVTPIIRSITDWRLGAAAAYLYEVKVGKGRMMVTTFNFEQALAEDRPEARWLLHELIGYCNSDRFQPAVQLPAAFLLAAIAGASVR